jgi:O-glycosyl hydrolase
MIKANTFRNHSFWLFILSLVLFIPAGVFSQTSVTLDFLEEHQEIDGFRGYGGVREFFYGTVSGYPDWYSSDVVDFLVNDMGQTVIRVNMVGSFNYKEGTFDPDMKLPRHSNNGKNAVSNDSYSNLKNDGSYLNSSIPFVKAMDAELRTNGDSLKLMLSLWSPLAWMKENNDFMRGRLWEKNYGKFAESDQDLLEFIQHGIGQLDNTFDPRRPAESARMSQTCFFSLERVLLILLLP